MRLLWRGLVSGYPFVIYWWAFILAVDVAVYFAFDKLMMSAIYIDLPIFLLNLYSWDMQRRRARPVVKAS